MKRYGLVGYPLTHSFSKSYFTEKFQKEKMPDCIYENFPIQSLDELPRLIKITPDLTGLNVTIPYKVRIFSFLNEWDENANEIKAVNTIKIIRKEGITSLKGYNTDAYGFYTSLKPLLTPDYKNALILGTGGASKAIAYILEKTGIRCMHVSRNPKRSVDISYADLCGPVLYSFQLIINASPVGMYPDTDACPDIPYEFITRKHLLYDLVYNPLETKFMKKGKDMGARVMNGLQMLYLQAEKAWEIWNT
jgi:shikimate dehydrogenase